jgi:hypothetical protein
MMRADPSMALYRRSHQTALSGCGGNAVVVNVKEKVPVNRDQVRVAEDECK